MPELLSNEPTETLVAAEDPASSALLDEAFLIFGGQERDAVRELREGEEVTLGRSDLAELYIDDHSTSRRHARILLENGAMYVEDLNSRNGTRVNGKIIRGTRERVYGGDVIQVGPMVINIVFGSNDQKAKGGAEGEPALEAERGIVIVDPRMVEIYALLERVAPQRTTVLILGETGVGKELIAQRLHELSPRSEQPLVRLNCAALPDSLLESELFGYERGAFSGAERKKVGYFEAADQGTLFLDEIGELSPTMQVKLLHVLENRVISRLGGVKEIPVDVRLVAATHRDLEAEVKAGRFREDLYYRISPFRVRVPPLRERRSELRPLAERFARTFAAEMKLRVPRFTPGAFAAIERHSWPGNVRELRNAIEYAVVMAHEDTITEADLPEDFSRGSVGRSPARG